MNNADFKEYQACQARGRGREMWRVLTRVTDSVYGYPSGRDNLPSPRKLRLIAAALCDVPELRRKAEELADHPGNAGGGERYNRALGEFGIKLTRNLRAGAASVVNLTDVFVSNPEEAAAVAIDGEEDGRIAAVLCELLRSNGRRFDPAWRTPEALSLAKRAYDERDWGVLPVLADCLEIEAGYDDGELLAHLRSSTARHLRGCWALDLVLGKD